MSNKNFFGLNKMSLGGAAFFSGIPLVLGIYLIVESMTFGQWRTKCFITKLANIFDTVATCINKGIGKCDTNNITRIILTLAEGKNNENSSDKIHFYPGIVLMLIGLINLFILALSPEIHTILVTPTQCILLVILVILLLLDIIIDVLGIGDIDLCFPNIDPSFENYQIVTLIIYVTAIIFTIYAPAFI